MTNQFPSTYQQYKHKTSQALGWLVATATELGLVSKTGTKHPTVPDLKAAETPEKNGGRNYFAVLGGKSRAATSADNNEADHNEANDNEADSKTGLPLRKKRDVSGRKRGDTPHDSKESASSKIQSSADYVGLLPEDGEDPLMEISFLLEDAHEVRQHIQRLWRRYQNLEIDLITTMVVTQEAFYRIYLINRELVQKYPLIGDHDHLASYLAYHVSLGGYPYKKFCRMWCGDRSNDMYRRMVKIVSRPDKKTNDWLFIDAFLVHSSIAAAQGRPGGISMEKWLRSRYDSEANYDLASLAKDLRCMLSAYTEANRPPKFVTKIDYFTSSLRKLSRNTAIHAEEVFMGRVVLDLLGMDGLQQHVDDDIERYLSHGQLKGMRERDRTVLYDSRDLDPIGYFISVLESCLSKNKPAAHNPIFLGNVLVSVVERISANDLYAVNESGYLLQAAHIYNSTLVDHGSRATRWPDMDALIALQKVQIFAGEPPTTDDQCYKRFFLALGLKPSEIKGETESGY
ncbi:methyltransferase domain-containing protein [Colletotrichum sojae]|uniref:Methyltransferase domain-containing protein n=1 Tax=Colletotrichum sojae TaxID=2175907 RepID=A0A8H6MIH5_9PEZI|nr:methyltransferase domain-containing protein [Colletotrichum sojae]